MERDGPFVVYVFLEIGSEGPASRDDPPNPGGKPQHHRIEAPGQSNQRRDQLV